MRLRAFHILVIVLLSCSGSWAQTGIYVPIGGKVYLASDTAGFFSNTLISGNLGLATGSVLHFKGQRWENSESATITHEDLKESGLERKGGELRFAGLGRAQIFTSGYNAATGLGPRLCRLTIDNPQGLMLEGSTRVVHELVLGRGSLFLNKNTLVLGYQQPGMITGYNHQRFIVTGSEPGSGGLVREGISRESGTVIFPVGTTPYSYSPAAIQALGTAPDDYLVSVWDDVRSEGVRGFILTEQTVNKTWELGKLRRPGQDAVRISLQHNEKEGGPDFRLNQARAYIAHFNQNNWDTAAPGTNPQVSFTTGAAISGMAAHSRLLPSGLGRSTLFTKFALPDTTLRTEMNLYGYRMDSNKVQVSWGVQPEVGVAYYIVQRWFPNLRTVINVDTVATKASNRYSAKYLYYETRDVNRAQTVSYYRLRIRHFAGPDTYSETIAVAGWAGSPQMHIWPNPARQLTYVAISTTYPVEKLVVWNALGQKLAEEAVSNRRIIPMKVGHLPGGNYIIGILSPAGKLLGSEKLVKQGE